VIKVLHIRSETFKVVQEQVLNTLEHIDIGSKILNNTLVAQELRERIGKWDHMKLKSFCTKKSQLFEEEAHRMGKNLFHLCICKILIIRIYRELKTLNSQRNNGPMKKRTRMAQRLDEQQPI
jgi:hypothetical protein